jgi:hypothetical protein
MPIPQQSIKQQIIERAIGLLGALPGEEGIREIARTRTLFLQAAMKPAIHVVAGPEIVLEEDDRGYTLEFPLFFKLYVSEARNLEDQVDRMVWKIQEKLEADPQLNGSLPTAALASKLTYDGEQPFGEEILKPEGGTVIAYVVQYRRYRAEPKSTY